MALLTGKALAAVAAGLGLFALAGGAKPQPRLTTTDLYRRTWHGAQVERSDVLKNLAFLWRTEAQDEGNAAVVDQLGQRVESRARGIDPGQHVEFLADPKASRASRELAGRIGLLETRPERLRAWAAGARANGLDGIASELEGKATTMEGMLRTMGQLPGQVPSAPNAGPSTTTPPPRPPVPAPRAPSVPSSSSAVATADIAAQIAAAVASRSPAEMRRVAAELERNGFPGPAAELRRTATQIEELAALAEATRASSAAAAAAAAEAAQSAGLPPLPSSPAQAPAPAPPSLPIPTVDPKRQLANELANHLRSLGSPAKARTSGRVNEGLVRAYQAQEGLTVDGRYGPGTAITLAERYNIVPPRPLYYSKNWKAQKREYKGKLATFAAADPARRVQWTEAAKVDAD